MYVYKYEYVHRYTYISYTGIYRTATQNMILNLLLVYELFIASSKINPKDKLTGLKDNLISIGSESD